MSPSYISQVKHGKCRPSQRLIQALAESRHHKKPPRDYLKHFLDSRKAMGCSTSTLSFYRERLERFVSQADFYYWEATPQQGARYTRSFNFNDAMKFYKGTSGIEGHRRRVSQNLTDAPCDHLGLKG